MMNQSAYHPAAHFPQLLELLSAMIQVQAGVPIPPGQDWHNDRQTLGKKLAYHLWTLNVIRDGYPIVIAGVHHPIVDHGSIKVLARAVFENYIVFAHIYGNEDEELCRFRHMTWKLAGLMDRQRRVPLTAENREKLEQELRTLKDMQRAIEGHPVYRTYTNGQRKALVKRGDWSAGRSWSDLASAVGLNERYFRNVYGYLCDYSHSSYAAALQVRDACTLEEEVENSNAILGAMNMVMAHFITLYGRLFASAADVLKSSPTQPSVDLWCFASHQFDSIYRPHGAN